MSEGRRDEEPPDRGIAMRIAVSGGDDGSQVELTAVMPAFAMRHEVDTMLDKLMGAARRQRAIQQLPELRHTLDGHQERLAEARLSLAAHRARLAEGKAIRDEKRLELTREKDQILAAAQQDHEMSGRRGEFKPAGAVRGEVSRITAAIELSHQSADKEAAEGEKAKAELISNINSYENSVKILTRRIGECEEMARDDGTNGSADLRRGA